MKTPQFFLAFFALSLSSLFLFSACEEDPVFNDDGIYIRLKNDTGTQLTDLDYSFGFEENTEFVHRINPGRFSAYRRFENADRCSGIFLEGSLSSGGTVEVVRSLCAIADPIAPGRYSFVIRQTMFTRNDGSTGTFIDTEVVED